MSHSAPRLAELNPSRVCIIKPSSMGDVVHALPILAALRTRWPSAHLAWVINRPFQDLVRHHRDLDEIIVYNRSGNRWDPLGLQSATNLFQRLARRQFDLTIDLQGLLRSALMTAATRARVRVGLADAREGARWFYTDLVDAPRLGLHAVERIQRIAQALGADATIPRFNLNVTQRDRDWARTRMAGIAGPRVVLNVGARWETKRWPPAHFAEIGRRAVREFGASLIAVGAPGDRPLVDELNQSLAPIPVLDLCGRTSLLELAALAGESDLLISNDTGPLHVAAAAGTRVIGIYTCTDPVLTGPFGTNATTIQSCVWCAPSFIRTCRRLECMSELSPDRVWPVVAAQLKTIGSEHDGGQGRQKSA